MAVYARCTKCKTRREKTVETGSECLDKSAHKRFVAWTADVQFSRTSPRLKKSYRVDKHEKPRELAEKQERDWLTAYEKGKLEYKKDAVQAMRFDVLADEWWERHEAQSLIEGARRNDIYRVRGLKKILGTSLIGNLGFKDGDGLVSQRLRAGLAIGSIRRELRVLQSIMNYAVKAEYVEKNPFTNVKCPGKENVHDRWMTQNEVDALVNAARELGDNDLVDIIAVGVNTGFRKGNLERLEARDIRNNRIYARVTKSGEPYDVPITASIVSTLQRLVALAPTGALLKTNHLGPRFRAAARKAGLYTDKKDLQRVTVHTLRHTFAVLYLNRGGDLYDLSKLLGHATTAITDKVYARHSKQRKDSQAPLMSTPISEAPAPTALEQIERL